MKLASDATGTPVRAPRPSAVPAATIGYGDAPKPAVRDDVAETLAQSAPPVMTLSPAESVAARAPAQTPAWRTTVLPRVDWSGQRPALSMSPRSRFEKIRPLGEGGVGEVSLVHDYDIDRDVAVKRLHPHFNDAVSLMRFAEEVRAVGNLEHPNIAPVHDVGIDENGQHFLMMKYVQGETLETIIERLAAKDPAYQARYTYDARVEIYRGILRALQYAHARGIIHRDIKPSNVMIGPYGEVVLMDWGLAKQIRNAPAGADVDRLGSPIQDSLADIANLSERARMVRTQHGAILGTPIYMSPEQARGDIAHIDERSDIYSVSVLFHELMTLEHYLADKETIASVLAAVIQHDHTRMQTVRESSRTGAPVEFLHVARHGMRNDPALRFQTAGDILARLQENADGLTPIECPVTMMKRASGESMRFIDRHPLVALGGALAGVAGTLSGVAFALINVLH